ncbi:MAG: HPr(Ser) kinase/phosphatase [Acholeplasmataceae bacterium]|nr:MAG: HPr(Ser) kinase/phosphatase [Acholeplasmataceae bacterium]
MPLTVTLLVRDLELDVLHGEQALKRTIKNEMLSRPGVELAGFFDFFEPERIVLIGSKEKAFMKLMDEKTCHERLEKIFSLQPPCVIFSINVHVDDVYIKLGQTYNVAILKSKMRTTAVSSQLYAYLHSKLAPRISVHGVLLDIHGMGTLITGKSGIGKSETALELVKRGHLLISDDRVDIFEQAHGVLVGHAPKLLERYIEVRGIGIVDVVSMFGAGAYRESKKIRLVVELEQWQKGKQYDRLGIETETVKYFSTEIAKITIPILPGRNVATLVESAAMNQKLKYLGYHAALTLTEEVAKKASRIRKEDDEHDEDL